MKPIYKSIQTALVMTFISGALMGAGTALAHDEKRNPGTFSMQGTGTISATPDLAYLSSGVVTNKETAEAALAENNAKMSAVFKALQAAGIEAKHISTSNFSVQPVYPPKRNKSNNVRQSSDIIGYRVTNRIQVKVVELDKLGTVLTQMVSFGANSLGRIRFDISNRAELLDQARAKAVADAKRKAKIYLDAAGVEMGRVLSISENGFQQPHFAEARALAASPASTPVPVAAGERNVSINVNITWEIEQ